MRRKEGREGGGGKTGAFDFLEFIFYCGENRARKFYVIPRISRKKFRAKVKEIRQWLRKR